MDPFLTSMLIGGGASLAGGLLGASAQSQANATAQRLAKEAYDQFGNVKLPDINDEKLNLTAPELQYLQNYMENAQSLGPSEMTNISIDPRLQTAQMNALDTLSKIGSSGGMTDIERAQLNAVHRETDQQDQARQQAILQNMAERGMGGSGVELAARLSSSQHAADRASQEGDRTAAEAQQRALQAIAQSGSLGSQMQGQQFGEKSQVAQAQDAIARFNNQNSQEVARRNIERQNAEQAAKQSMLEKQVALQNQQQQYNKELLQKGFTNQMQLASGKAGALTGQIPIVQQAGAQQGAMWGGIGQGLAQTAGAYANYQGTQNLANAFKGGGGGPTVNTDASNLPHLQAPNGYLGGQ